MSKRFVKIPDMKDAGRAIYRDNFLRLFWAYFVVLGLIVWLFST